MADKYNPSELKILFTSVNMLDLPIRPLNCFNMEHIQYIGDLIQWDEEELIKLRNLGRKSLNDIKTSLNKLNLNLGIKIPDWKTLSAQELAQRIKDIEELGREIESSSPIDDKNYLVKLIRKVEELSFSVRSSNCLRSLHIIYIGDLVTKKRSELLKNRNLGRKSLAEIERKLANLGLRLNTEIKGWPPYNLVELIEEKYSKDLEEERQREANEIQRDVWLDAKKVDREEIDDGEGVGKIKLNFLEDHLNYLSKLDGKERNRHIIVKYYGWDGKGPKTLDITGKEFGLTRERVRQIINRFEKRINSSDKLKLFYTPYFQNIFDIINDNSPELSINIEQKLIEKSVIMGKFSFNSFIAISRLFGIKMPFRNINIRGSHLVVPHKSIKAIKKIIIQAKKAVEHWGVGSISDITAQVREEITYPVTDGLTILILSLFNDFKWLDESSGWFWISSVPRNRLLNLLKKIFSVSGEINVSDLRAGIQRPHRMVGFAPPRRVLLELCRQISWCRVSGNLISAEPPLDWEKILAGTNSYLMVAILKKYGPVMTSLDFEKKCLELGVNRSTFWTYLSYSPLIANFDTNNYGLRGTKIPPMLIDYLKLYRRQTKVIKDYGWTGKGDIWILFNISESMFRTNIFNIPAAIKKYVQGDFILKTFDGSLIGPIKIKENAGWPLTQLFRRRGGEVDDYLIMLFDLQLREIKASIGDKDLKYSLGIGDKGKDFLPSDIETSMSS